MISGDLLDQIIPIPDEGEKMEEIQQELAAEGFAINNFNKGGVFYILARICVRIGIEIKQLARKIINSSFIRHAEGAWLEIKAADFSKRLKVAIKAQGYISLYRKDSSYSVQINKGHMFKTYPDLNGNEYKFYALENTVIPAGQDKGRVLVEAEQPGTAYNVLPGQIQISMIHLEGIDYLDNEKDWLYVEGTEEEELESLRERTLSSYAELAERTIEAKLRNRVLSVPGVITARIDSQHPRGQATVDIIITGSAGVATPELITKVDKEIEPYKGNYEDFLVKSAQVYQQNFELIIYLADDANQEGVADQAQKIIENLLKLSRNEELNFLYRDSIIGAFDRQIMDYRKTMFLDPKEDVILGKDQVILPGKISIQVREISGGRG